MTRTHLFRAAALLLLIGALIFFNLSPGPAAPKIGSAPGEQLADFSLTCLDGSVFTLSQHRGQTVVVNWWATWCGPCVKELPLFDRLQTAYGENVFVLAIHSDLVTEDVPAWLSDAGYQIAFAVDEAGQIAPLFGVTDLLPQTLVLSPDGVISYNQPGAVTWETLQKAVENSL